MTSSSGTENVIAALELRYRVFKVFLSDVEDGQLEEVMAAMQVPFPELESLQLGSPDETLSGIPIPDSFLGGSAARLRYFALSGIPFPGLPKLLWSSTHLVDLWLVDIPHSGYISPQAMVALLSALSSLETLSLKFQSPQSRPDWESRGLPPLKRSILPALDEFYFTGVIDYLEEFVTGIDTPQLDEVEIAFFNQIDFDCQRLAQFINRTPTLRAFDEAHVQFYDGFAYASFKYSRRSWSNPNRDYDLVIAISCREPDWQLSAIEQVCNSYSRALSTIKHLYIEHDSKLVWKNDAIENFLWLQLLHPFTAVENLYLSKESAPGIAAALEDLVGDRTTEVLHSLKSISLKLPEPLEPFRDNRFVVSR